MNRPLPIEELVIKDQAIRKIKTKTIAWSESSPSWHIKWFDQHYKDWLCKAPVDLTSFFWGTDIPCAFCKHLTDLGFYVVLYRPLHEEDHLIVYVTPEEYLMEELRTIQCESI